MDDQQEPTIEQFRSEAYPRYIEKGIEPPEAGSEREQELFGRWIAGWKKMSDNE